MICCGAEESDDDVDESTIWDDWIKQLESDIADEEFAIDAPLCESDYARTGGCSALSIPIVHRLIHCDINTTVPPFITNGMFRNGHSNESPEG